MVSFGLALLEQVKYLELRREREENDVSMKGLGRFAKTLGALEIDRKGLLSTVVCLEVFFFSKRHDLNLMRNAKKNMDKAACRVVKYQQLCLWQLNN